LEDHALSLLEAGADRIGTSASLKILNEWRASLVATR
jgi:deoxyribose-phosphate aldolase